MRPQGRTPSGAPFSSGRAAPAQSNMRPPTQALGSGHRMAMGKRNGAGAVFLFWGLLPLTVKPHGGNRNGAGARSFTVLVWSLQVCES